MLSFKRSHFNRKWLNSRGNGMGDGKRKNKGLSLLDPFLGCAEAVLIRIALGTSHSGHPISKPGCFTLVKQVLYEFTIPWGMETLAWQNPKQGSRLAVYSIAGALPAALSRLRVIAELELLSNFRIAHNVIQTRSAFPNSQMRGSKASRAQRSHSEGWMSISPRNVISGPGGASTSLPVRVF